MSKPPKDTFQIAGSQVGPGRIQNESVGSKSKFQVGILNDQNSSNKKCQSRLVGHN